MNQFELFLNRMRGGNMPNVNMPMPPEPQQPDFKVPSQMPGAMGGGFDHGIQQMPYRYGDQTGGIQQMPYIDGQGQGGIQQMPYIPGTSIGNMGGVEVAQGRGGFNVFNPLTYGNMGKAIDKTRAGDKNVEYSDSAVGAIGKAANEKNRLIQQMLQGY